MVKNIISIILICTPLFIYAETTNTTRKIIPIFANNKIKYNYYYHGETLQQALNMYAKNSMLLINFSPSLNTKSLKKTVSGQFSSADSTGLLDTLSKQYGFEWFIYSGTLYITATTLVNRSIEVAPEDMPMVKNNLKTLGLYNSKFGYSELPAENRIIINGPKQYTEMMIQQIKSLNIAPTNQQFAVYRLKYANANDMSFNFNNQQITIPGVATILQNILNGNNSNLANGANRISSNIITPTKNQATADIDLSTNNNSETIDSNKSAGKITSTVIQADSRLNAIIVRDKNANLNTYKKLIKSLDVPTPLIQIEVLIIRLDQDALSQQGINWWASAGGLRGGVGIDKLKKNTGTAMALSYGALNPTNLLVSNLEGFLMSLEFLEQNNIAKATGRPSIATIDNIPAIVNVNQNLLIANPRNDNDKSSAQIQTVSTSLQVTPHIIFGKNNQRQIKLSMVLQDGNLADPAVSSISSIVQSNITSQAVLNEGQSILLAGYTKDVSQKEVSAVPYLSSIPLLGWFFKNETTKLHKLTTLYLVTPKIIWMDTNTAATETVTINGKKLDVKNDIRINDKKQD